NVMLGYWRDPAATRRVLRSGWLWTGDLATTDAEGWIYLRGRKNQWVKIAGHRVHPSEIEQFLRMRHPQLELVVVPFDGPQRGTRLALFVRSDSAGSLSEEELIVECRGSLPGHKVPKYVEKVVDFPRTPARKVALHVLAARATAASLAIWNREQR
ncbi:MAG TPA: hypothetical protein VIY86_08315, partial [Pirellulaceae bacterium]